MDRPRSHVPSLRASDRCPARHDQVEVTCEAPLWYASPITTPPIANHPAPRFDWRQRAEGDDDEYRRSRARYHSAARAVLEPGDPVRQLSGTDVHAVHVREGPPDQLANLEALTGDAEVPLRIIEGPLKGALCDALGAHARCSPRSSVLGPRPAANPVGGRTPVGRTALHLLGHVDKPVLVVPPETVATGSIRRLLVPLEGGDVSSRPVIEQLRPLLVAEVEVVVLQCSPGPPCPPCWTVPVATSKMFGREFLTRHCPTANSVELRPGPVAQRVAEVSREYGADLVVLTWSGDTSAGRATVVREVLGASAFPSCCCRSGLLGRRAWTWDQWP